MARRVPEGPPPPPTVQRLRLRYAKRGRLRFTSHRDFARAFERALRRAEIPMAYSAGFSPHPKISYVGAAPTGVASEAEYLEIGLAREIDPEAVRSALDAVLPDGLDIDEVVVAGPGSLAERMHASRWRIELPGVSVTQAQAAVETFLATSQITVERMTKSGRRELDTRAPVLSMIVLAAVPGVAAAGDLSERAILVTVVRQVTPTVRPDDVVVALRDVAGLAPTGPPIAARLAQGPLDDAGEIGDPLVTDRDQATTPP
ncbi:TIGR03936 family radical SAM-associated protein [uncultured Jatrophihabitans sp.]|uniref:TIGR03936 family radical SAM-associated protein n=1 Tax=uncultured Jatrophihabitans sp. TaxID=1610747 RepID=UPI0035CCA386